PAARLALRTQQVIAHESGVADAADPLGGSWLIERWTDDVVAAARDYLAKIAELGGARAAIEKGFQQEEIAEAAYRAQRDVEEGRAKVVGVNVHIEDDEPPVEILEIDPAGEAQQVARLADFRARRDGGRARGSLAALETAAGGDHNLLPAILDAVRAEATLGEIAHTLRRVYGEHHDAGFD
ncbi:MAG TPA: methylmalonyl-CoA mutase family protein, partial [Thermoanaerobaculia bacterium]|nr:methylmalonyl-CoA mutase family protein [Thermoanaerobaculia bacterium]